MSSFVRITINNGCGEVCYFFRREFYFVGEPSELDRCKVSFKYLLVFLFKTPVGEIREKPRTVSSPEKKFKGDGEKSDC